MFVPSDMEAPLGIHGLRNDPRAGRKKLMDAHALQTVRPSQVEAMSKKGSAEQHRNHRCTLHTAPWCTLRCSWCDITWHVWYEMACHVMI